MKPIVCLIALSFSPPVFSQAPAREVLARMDAAAGAFRGISARISRVMHTAIINDNSSDSGMFRMLKKGKDVRVLIQFDKPEPKSVAFDSRTAQVFNPKTKTVQVFDLGKQKSLVEQFLLLGFGSSGRELAKNYEIRYLGDETVSSQKTSRLELIPKSAKVREHYNKIELWIAGDGGHPIRQKLHEPSGNYMLMTYTEIQLNPPLNFSELELKLPADIKREFPQRQ
jgi:outer membrane lipoprotein-sorting protein